MLIACPDCAVRLNVADAMKSKPEQKALCPGCKKVFLLRDGISAMSKGAAAPTRLDPPAPPPAVPPPAARPPAAVPPPAVPPPVAKPAAPPAPAPGPKPPAAPAPAPAGGFDPLATRKMPSDEIAELRAAAAAAKATAPAAAKPSAPEITLEEAMAGAIPPDEASGDRFEVHRPDYAGTTFSLEELKDLVKRGWLDRTDGIRTHGVPQWASAIEHPVLAKAFAVRAKLDSQKLQAVKGPALTCVHHPKARATHRCDTCSRAFCAECGNETELRQQPVVLCVECDVPMKPLAAR